MPNTESVKGYTINLPGAAAPWGVAENQLFNDIVDKLPDNTKFLADGSHGHSTLADSINDATPGTTVVTAHNGKLGVSTTNPKTLLHVSVNDLSTPISNGQIALESSNNANIQIMTAATKKAGIVLGNPSNALASKLEYDNSTDILALHGASSGLDISAKDFAISSQLNEPLSGIASVPVSSSALSVSDPCLISARYTYIGIAPISCGGGNTALFWCNPHAGSNQLVALNSADDSVSPFGATGAWSYSGGNFKFSFTAAGGNTGMVADVKATRITF